MSNAPTTPTLLANERNSELPEIGDRGSLHRGLAASGTPSIVPAPNAAACSALGCHETRQLLRAVIDDVGIRVLCPDHLARLIRRESPDDE